MNKHNRNRLIDAENILMVDRWEGFQGMDEKDEGIKKYKLVPNSNGDVKYSIGNKTNCIVIPLYAARWLLD